MIRRRLDLKEILPHWHRLGLGMTYKGSRPSGGAMALLEHCLTCDKMEVVAGLSSLFQAGFEGILHPRLTDAEHQGFRLPPVQEGSPLALLAEGSKLIQELFIKTEDAKISLLPRLHPEFHAGRFIDWKLESGKFISNGAKNSCRN